VDRTFSFAEAAAAYRYMEDGRQHGKIILVPEGVAAEGPDGD
jgi:NADPH:quinone reductase-like Zn-dependent oxidoreductase